VCSRFIPLVRDEKEWFRSYGDVGKHTLPSGTLETYLTSGLCRLEIVAALCPKRYETGAWRTGPLNMRFRYHQTPQEAGTGRRVTSVDLLDPREGFFQNKADQQAIAPVLMQLALEYAAYEESGSESWDNTIDVSSRPQWLKDLAIEARSAHVAPTSLPTPRGKASRV